MNIFTLNPDFNKLKAYEPQLTDEMILQIQSGGGMAIELNYMDDENLNKFSCKLEGITKQHGLQDHFTELLYLILKMDEYVNEAYFTYWDNYRDDVKSKEVAQFLLAYKELKGNQQIKIIIETPTSKVKITTFEIAKWMAGKIYETIDNNEFPYGAFGFKIVYDLFGASDFTKTNGIPLENLKRTAQIKPKNPKKQLHRLSAQLCAFLLPYLNEHTDLKARVGTKYSAAQLRFLYEVLDALEYIELNHDSPIEDYMSSLMANHIKPYKSRQ